MQLVGCGIVWLADCIMCVVQTLVAVPVHLLCNILYLKCISECTVQPVIPDPGHCGHLCKGDACMKSQIDFN